ncbi:hypothetical protein BKA62DRAFT_718623 [Auriculariales sp. MPI-PUGE-AT-0066]|nr:hypothetical protein BKA62DRAFT_718623 [Auriculariales sp. MPI-PUGE-AT-0066]
MLSPRFATAPLELIDLLLEHVARSYAVTGMFIECGRLAKLALVSRRARDIVVPLLYEIIEIKSVLTARRLLRSLWNRRSEMATFAATHIRALHLFPMGNPATVDHLVLIYLVDICPTALIQASDHVFYEFTKRYQKDALDNQRRWSVMASGRRNLNAPTASRYLHLTYHPSGDILRRPAAARDSTIWLQLISSAPFATHVAIDWPQSESYEVLGDFLRWMQTPSAAHIARVVLRLPTWADDVGLEIRLRNLAQEIAKIGGEIKVALFVVDMGAVNEKEAYDRLPLEGWKRHAIGVEDLWMTGQLLP